MCTVKRNVLMDNNNGETTEARRTMKYGKDVYCGAGSLIGCWRDRVWKDINASSIIYDSMEAVNFGSRGMK